MQQKSGREKIAYTKHGQSHSSTMFTHSIRYICESKSTVVCTEELLPFVLNCVFHTRARTHAYTYLLTVILTAHTRPCCQFSFNPIDHMTNEFKQSSSGTRKFLLVLVLCAFVNSNSCHSSLPMSNCGCTQPAKPHRGLITANAG